MCDRKTARVAAMRFAMVEGRPVPIAEWSGPRFDLLTLDEAAEASGWDPATLAALHRAITYIVLGGREVPHG